MKQKTTWMQLLIIGLISSIILFSCKKVDNEKLADYIYVNPTSHNITIQCYCSGIDSSYELNNNNTLKIKEDLMSGGSFIIVRADSVKITYDQLKCEMYRKTADSKGILNLEDYSYKKVASDHHEYTFTFTEDMYNNAKNCQ